MQCSGPFEIPRRGILGLNAMFFGVQTHFSPDLRGLNRGEQQSPHPHEIVGAGRKGENPSDFEHSAVSGLAQCAYGLQPAEYFLDPLSFPLTDFVSGVARRASSITISCAGMYS